MENKNDNHPLDLSYLIQMVGHNPEFMIEVFDTFLAQTPFYMAELEDAMLHKSWEKVGNCAHKIKPTFSYVGRADIKDFVQKIEHNARNLADIDQLPADIERLKITVVAIYRQIEAAKKELIAKD
ncbi:Hpt domain-containing protein [Pedobacter sandarakinus]|uniref:Hpt domain-containing protein n=1 Tax=Pedobacter sandarakinus TaxID=353156 RepID=UPI002247E638|nr:Hpt domain-containing protein [Pedobacter sandarakinus]MCX2574845.1 Hpt domain-containing protein [Pedobacter sandarakinus]